MDLGISDKKAIICASSRGLGKACAYDLAKEGVEIFINGTNQENLDKTELEFKNNGFKVKSVLGPMEDSSTREALLDLCPDPDILINNSGGPPPGNFFDWSEEDFLSAIKSNFTQSALLMQAVIPKMKEKNFGRIVNITSAMVKNPHLIMGLSTSARSGLHGLSKALSREVAQFNITINNLLPERIDTDRQTQILNFQAKLSDISFEESRKELEDSLTAKRMGTVEEFSGICTFLCSKQAAYISGQNISVDGGNSTNLI
ncbi:MAG: SDR family NAD(P)-dependent oxidoreductase [Gammaproteobacteria bacterium]|nr:MAG: SDR family NAD(P)-dependent oxidoreductase [Gammaproteobacteria bacterium]